MKGLCIFAHVCQWMRKLVITPHHSTQLQPVQLRLTWTEEAESVLRSRALTVTNLSGDSFSGVLDHLPVRHKCSSFNFFVLIESSLSAVVLCAISILTKKAAVAQCVGPVCYRWLLIEASVELEWVKWSGYTREQKQTKVRHEGRTRVLQGDRECRPNLSG